MKHFPALMKTMAAALCLLATALPASAKIQQRPANLLRTPDAPSGNLNVLITRYYGMQDISDSFWGTINPNTGELKKQFSGMDWANGEEYDMQSGVVRNDIVYIPQLYYNELGMITGEGEVRWKRFDITTGEQLEPISFGGTAEGLSMYFYSMTYDDQNDCFYGLNFDLQTEIGGRLVKIDCSGPESTWKAEFYEGDLGGVTTDWMANVCYNPTNGNLYGQKSNGSFYQIILGETPEGKPKADLVKLMEYDDFNEYYCYPLAAYTAPMCYSPYDHAFLTVYLSETGDPFKLVSIDAETFEAFEISDLDPMAYVAVLHCADPYADDKAPNRMAAPTVNFTDASLSGTYTVNLPSTRFDGSALTEDVTVHVLVDNNEVETFAGVPATSHTGNLTVTQGLHKLAVYASLGDLKGPQSSVSFYAGHDQPYSPTNLKLMDGVLSWNAPRNEGVHKGYLDLSNVTYNVYLNGEKFNDAPISDTKCDFVINEKLNKRSSIEVTAVANEMESAHSDALTRVLGTGYDIPVNWMPSAQEATLFETYNLNNDNFAFTYSEDNQWYRIYTTDYQQSPDDWLMTPPFQITDAESLYSLIFGYSTPANNATFYDDLDIYVGKEPLPEKMSQLIYSHEYRAQPDLIDINVRFSVSEPGTYYIGFHSKNPNKTARYRGTVLKDFRLAKDDSSSAAPADPTDVEITPAPLGELFYNISATLPTKSINGNDLPADTEITLTAQNDFKTVSVKGKPGEKVSFKLDAGGDGWCPVYLTPSTSEGNGYNRYYSYYVGIDAPLAPENIKGIVGEDNLTVELSWDPVGEVGQNGGYVDVDGVTYDIYTHSSITSTKVGTSGNKTTYTFKIGQGGNQSRYNISPVAVNEIGTSVNGTVFNEILGRPYELPFIEEFGYAAFNYSGWSYNASAPFNGVEWSHCTDASGYGAEAPMAFDGNGAFQASGIGVGELRAQKVSTKNIEHAMVSMKVWDYSNAGKLELWGRSYSNQEFEKVAEWNPSRSTPQWDEWLVYLPDSYSKQGWCQFNVRCVLENGQQVLIDNYQVLQHTANDFRVSDLSMPTDVIVGQTLKATVVVTNAGEERNNGTLKVDLIGDSNILATVEENINGLVSGKTYEFIAEFPMLESYTKYEFLEISAEAACDNDENHTNDLKSMDFALYDHSIPIVRDLKAQRLDNGQDVKLTWSTPKSQAVGRESFETYQRFKIADEIGPFKVYDLDGGTPFAITGVRFANDDKPAGWVVFDAESANAMDKDRLTPHSGSRMLIARSISFDESEVGTETPAALDVLVSPEVVGGTKVKFWMTTFDSSLTETIQWWYSTTDDQLDPDNVIYDESGHVRGSGSFKWGGNFNKSGTDIWEDCEFTLPADAKYFALAYVSIGQFGCGIDDLTYEAANPYEIVPEYFDLYNTYDGENFNLVAPNLTDTEFTHVTGNEYQATYYLRSIFTDDAEEFQSPLSNPAFVTGTGVEDLKVGQAIGGGKGRILVQGGAGEILSLYDAQGRKVVEAVITSDSEVIPCAAGIYVARLGNAAVKVIVR